MNDSLSVKIPKAVYTGLHRAWASDPKDRLRYSISGTAARCKQLGENLAAEWVEKHDYLYGVGVWCGFHVDEGEPGDARISPEQFREGMKELMEKGVVKSVRPASCVTGAEAQSNKPVSAIAVDKAREGSDRTAIVKRQGNEVVSVETYEWPWSPGEDTTSGSSGVRSEGNEGGDPLTADQVGPEHIDQAGIENSAHAQSNMIPYTTEPVPRPEEAPFPVAASTPEGDKEALQQPEGTE